MKTLIHKLDKIGFYSSMTCAIHCMIMPLIITFLPYIGLSFFASELFEWIILFTSAALGISSICLGYNTHKNSKAAIMLSLGLVLMFLGRYAHENNCGSESVLILLIGGAAISTSHYINNKLCKSCSTCHN